MLKTKDDVARAKARSRQSNRTRLASPGPASVIMITVLDVPPGQGSAGGAALAMAGLVQRKAVAAGGVGASRGQTVAARSNPTPDRSGTARRLTPFAVLAAAPSGTHQVIFCSQPIRSVLAGRAAGMLEKSSRELRRMGLQLAVMSVPAETTGEFVGAIEDEDPATAAQVDPYEMGRLAIKALKEAEGGHVDRTQAAARLDLSLAQLYNRLDQRRIVAWVDAAGRYRFPIWQFGVNGMLEGVLPCLQLLDKADAWAIMRFFLTLSVGDVSPLHLLREGKIEEAKRIAALQSVHG